MPASFANAATGLAWKLSCKHKTNITFKHFHILETEYLKFYKIYIYDHYSMFVQKFNSNHSASV